jgi:hypothetical protein
MAKGQFYIIAAVFVLISLTVLFGFTLFVEAGSLTLPNHNTEFDNLQNAIEQRNVWLSNYWYDWTCQNKTVADIEAGYTNPVEFDAGITPCNQPIHVFKLSGITRTEITTDYITAVGCNVTFNATGVALYEVYWNCPSGMGPWPSLNGNEISPSKYISAIPAEGICSHFSTLLPSKNIAFSCSTTLLSNTYNYSVGFTATDFTYNGSMQ